MSKTDLSAEEARRIVLGAQGFGGPRTGGSLASVRKLAQRLGAYQIDSVNVLVRAHFMPAFSRLGPYPLDVLDKLAYDKQDLFEYWGHAACYLPMELYPAWRWRMEGRRGEEYAPNKAALDRIYKHIRDNGATGAGAIEIGAKGKGGWWGWSHAKAVVESLFRMGKVSVLRRKNFERIYDITERVIPADVLSKPALSADDGKKLLLTIAAKAHGIGTATDIAGYFHIENWWDRAQTSPGKRKTQLPRLIAELVDEGRLIETSVEGWDKPAYVVPGTKVSKPIHARALLSPFDPVMWERKPTQRVFGFDYKIEIYVPEPKRVYGYYCLPFLLGDRFVGRVDLKAERKTSTLLVPGAFGEPGVDIKLVAAELAGELRLMADWLGLEHISVGTKGNLAKPLSSALRSMLR